MYEHPHQGDAVHMFPLHGHIVDPVDAGNSICSQEATAPSIGTLKVLPPPGVPPQRQIPADPHCRTCENRSAGPAPAAPAGQRASVPTRSR